MQIIAIIEFRHPANFPNLLKFQSAPRVRTRGDRFTVIKKGLTEVSIRAPRSHAGRLCSPRAANHVSMFQSAPRVRTRGDRRLTTFVRSM